MPANVHNPNWFSFSNNNNAKQQKRDAEQPCRALIFNSALFILSLNYNVHLS